MYLNVCVVSKHDRVYIELSCVYWEEIELDFMSELRFVCR